MTTGALPGAEAAGRDDLAVEFDRRAEGYRAHWDASVGFMRPKLADGTFEETSTPSTHGQGFIEERCWN